MRDYRSPNLFEVDKVFVLFPDLLAQPFPYFPAVCSFAVAFADWWRADKQVLGFFSAEL